MYFFTPLTLFFLIFLLSPICSWYSRCDQAGRCYISDKPDDEGGIYLMPGYLPSFPDNSVTPTISSDSGDTAFSVDSLTGFSLNGPLSGKKGYECADSIRIRQTILRLRNMSSPWSETITNVPSIIAKNGSKQTSYTRSFSIFCLIH